MGLKLKVKYFDKEIEKIKKINKGDWIDLRSALGVGMVLPEGYEAHIAPRSSTFKNWKILQVNSVGIVDNSYSGDTDQWMMPVFATEDTEIKKNDRICQFRIIEKMPELEIEEVEHLNDKSRGGFGSTGQR